MTKLDDAQNWIVEIIGTIIFILSALNFILPMIGQPAYIDTTTSTIGFFVGLVFMGKKALANVLGNLFNFRK